MGSYSRPKNGLMKAAIDIGTNTALLLIAEIADGRLHVLHEEQRVPRLGQGVDHSGNISARAIDRVTKVLKEYRDILDQGFPEVRDVYVTATSAARDAANQSELLQKAEEATGFEIRILSGSEEAHYTFRGALSVLDDENRSEYNAVLDIGGGSTELVWGSGGEIYDRCSYDMGCVRFTERFLKDDPPDQEQIDTCKNAISEMLKEHKFNFKEDTSLVGVAGTVTSLAFIDMELEDYSSDRLAGHKLPKRKIDHYIKQFKEMTSSEILQPYPTVMAGRADIFLAGLLILRQVMEMYEFNQLTVSTGGIRHGAICENRSGKQN